MIIHVIYTYMYMSLSLYLYLYLYISIYIERDMFTCVCIHIYIYINKYHCQGVAAHCAARRDGEERDRFGGRATLYIYRCMCMCIYIYIYIYICICIFQCTVSNEWRRLRARSEYAYEASWLSSVRLFVALWYCGYCCSYCFQHFYY